MHYYHLFFSSETSDYTFWTAFALRVRSSSLSLSLGIENEEEPKCCFFFFPLIRNECYHGRKEGEIPDDETDSIYTERMWSTPSRLTTYIFGGRLDDDDDVRTNVKLERVTFFFESPFNQMLLFILRAVNVENDTFCVCVKKERGKKWMCVCVLVRLLACFPTLNSPWRFNAHTRDTRHE